MKDYIKHIILTIIWLLFIMGICSEAKAQYCVDGNCNSNTYMNSLDPNTIEYDNMVGVFHSTIVREYDGTIKVWGQGIAQNGSSSNGNVAPPQELSSTYYGSGSNQLSGTVLKFTAGSSTNSQQFAVVTTQGLYVWGNSGTMIATGISNAATGSFRKVAIGTYNVNEGTTKADGLPAGINPSDVKMMFGTRNGLAIVTCNGQAWVLAQNNMAYGDGASSSNANHALWHRVSTAANTPLENVVAVRGTYQAFMALTANGSIYTWGTNTRLGGNGSSQGNASRAYATPMEKPVGVTPKMIGMTSGNAYYLLATDGKLYAMGENGDRQLGDGTTTDRNVWIQVMATNTINGNTYTLSNNIVWISPQEHDGNYGAINVLTDEGKLWAWGNSDYDMLGTGSGATNPVYMPGRTTEAYNEATLNLSDKIMAVETGGHTTLTIKQCTTKFGYVGHKIRGSMANNTTDSGTESQYNYGDTAVLSICGAVSAPVLENLKVCQGTTAALPNAEPASLPSGATGIKWWTDAAATIPVSNPLSVAPGTYYATFDGLLVTCPTAMTVSYYAPTDAEYSQCNTVLITNPMVRQRVK